MHRGLETGKRDALLLAFLLGVAATLRLYQLGDSPFHHDESLHAFFSYQLWQGEPYRYDPVFHGPFLYWTNALVYSLLGASDFTARLLPALASIALLLPVWSLREELGRVGWKVAALFLLCSPTYVYYGRFLAHDNYCALFSLLLLTLAIGYLHRPTAWRTLLIGAVAGLFLATKAVSYLFFATVALFALLVFALDTFAPELDRRRMRDNTLQWLRYRWRHWGLALLALLAAYSALFTSFFSYWPGLWEGVFATLSHWVGQHQQARIPGPVYYYLPRLFLHEPVFLLAIPSLIWAARERRSPLDVFLAFWMVASLAIYGYAQEKVPWLTMHMLLPMFLLAGRWMDRLWQAGRYRGLQLGVITLLLAWSLRDTLWLVYRMPAASPHLLTYMASTPEIQQAATRIRSLQPDPGEVYLAGPGTWPMRWYLRDTRVEIGLTDGWQYSARLIEAAGDDAARLADAGFAGRDYPLMTWWTPDIRWLFSGDAANYVLHQRPTDDFGLYRFTLYQPAADRPFLDDVDD
ncbi:MAG: TIGR03663 family protein [Halioglobus sp.]|nr:TIGR03663 family protein [Halioglobus sp.]